MKYYKFGQEEVNSELKTKKIRISRVIAVLIVISVTVIVSVLVYQYRNNEEFREFFDVKILRKEISNENTINIDISSKNNPSVYAYSKYITILDKNVLEVYTNSSRADFTLDIIITNPKYADCNRFLCIAENEGSKAYLISGQNIVWQKDVEGQISRINVNKNGYVAIVTANSGYKTIVTLYNPNGDELFKIFLPTTYATDVDISPDNKYVAIAESDASGTIQQSDIRIVSVEDASFVKTYESGSKSLALNLKYQDRNNLICMYNDRVTCMQENVEELRKIDTDVLFADIELSNYIVEVSKQVSGVLKTDYFAQIINIFNNSINSYKLSGVPKAMYCNADIIAVNYGTEVEIINTDGWLVRRYKSFSHEIRDVSVSNNIIAVVYKDKVEIINL